MRCAQKTKKESVEEDRAYGDILGKKDILDNMQGTYADGLSALDV